MALNRGSDGERESVPPVGPNPFLVPTQATASERSALHTMAVRASAAETSPELAGTAQSTTYDLPETGRNPFLPRLPETPTPAEDFQSVPSVGPNPFLAASRFASATPLPTQRPAADIEQIRTQRLRSAEVVAEVAALKDAQEVAHEHELRREAAKRTRRDLNPTMLIGLGLVLALVMIVVLVVMVTSSHPKPTSPAVDLNASAAQVDLRGLAAAQDAHKASLITYTTDSVALTNAGYHPVTNANVTVLAGVNANNSYCLVAGGPAPSPWFLYDSSAAGLVHHTFASEAAAQSSCSDPAITSFSHIA